MGVGVCRPLGNLRIHLGEVSTGAGGPVMNPAKGAFEKEACQVTRSKIWSSHLIKCPLFTDVETEAPEGEVTCLSPKGNKHQVCD